MLKLNKKCSLMIHKIYVSVTRLDMFSNIMNNHFLFEKKYHLPQHDAVGNNLIV